MTINETVARERHKAKNARTVLGDLKNIEGYMADCNQLANWLEELQQYRAIGTVEECREAVEKQKAKRPDGGRDINGNDYLICPNCCAIVADSECKWVTSFCPDCGQKLDWSDEE